MVKLKAHIKKGTCPKSLRYNSRANIVPDEDFKKDISVIRKKAEQAVVGALVRFHQRRVDRLVIKKKRVEQTKSRIKNTVTNVTKSSAPDKTPSVARESNVPDQISKVNKMMSEFSKATKNKECESIPVFYLSFQGLIIGGQYATVKHPRLKTERKKSGKEMQIENDSVAP